MLDNSTLAGHESRTSAAGFTLMELMPSILILSLLMAAILSFLAQVQKRFQGQQVNSESSQGARGAIEILTQEIGQAGYNPNFTVNKTCAFSVAASADSQCITLSDISRINPGDWLSVDTGINNEIVQVAGTTLSGACTQANQVQSIFVMNHTSPSTTLPFPVKSYKLPYPTGILTSTGTSNDHNLDLFGDVNDDGTINYVAYGLTPTTSPATTLTINGQSYTLYNLTRSITPVNFKTGATKTAASPLVQNVIYQDIASTTTPEGPTGQPIFSYPQTYQVGIVPNQVTVVGTVNINICVAVNPQSMETNQVQWYTMATRIRPLNLASAVAVSLAGGFRFLPPAPAGVPMQ